MVIYIYTYMHIIHLGTDRERERAKERLKDGCVQYKHAQRDGGIHNTEISIILHSALIEPCVNPRALLCIVASRVHLSRGTTLAGGRRATVWRRRRP